MMVMMMTMIPLPSSGQSHSLPALFVPLQLFAEPEHDDDNDDDVAHGDDHDHLDDDNGNDGNGNDSNGNTAMTTVMMMATMAIPTSRAS